MFHVVLYQPDIPQNCGNIGRSCVAVGAKLWLVRPLGFLLDDRYLKRAGMDYWQHLDWQAVDSWQELEQHLGERPKWFFSRYAEKLVWDADFADEDVFVFGSETRGLPESLRTANAHRCLKLPMREEVRSLNLASTVNTVLYEGVRQLGGMPPATA
jgi:tRNA (cytidine/uridine-2'-O-)-methyltransferase